MFSQIMEGADASAHAGGCFEQTSSSAYPNIFAVSDLLKKNQAGAGVTLDAAEPSFNAGYQRL